MQKAFHLRHADLPLMIVRVAAESAYVRKTSTTRDSSTRPIRKGDRSASSSALSASNADRASTCFCDHERSKRDFRFWPKSALAEREHRRELPNTADVVVAFSLFCAPVWPLESRNTLQLCVVDQRMVHHRDVPTIFLAV